MNKGIKINKGMMRMTQLQQFARLRLAGNCTNDGEGRRAWGVFGRINMLTTFDFCFYFAQRTIDRLMRDSPPRPLT